MNSGSSWIDGDGQKKAITFEDIVIITPYNAQVFEIQQRLPGARVGTVDKFQGQQAAAAIYSMATSKPCGWAARHGIPLQPQQIECRDLPRQVHIRHCRGHTANCEGRVSHAPPDTASQRIVPLYGTGETNPVALFERRADCKIRTGV